jgi:hypothetical protein
MYRQLLYLGMERTKSLQSVNQLWDLCEDGAGPLRVLVKVADPPQRVRILLLLLLAGSASLPSQVQLLLQTRQPACTKFSHGAAWLSWLRVGLL